MSVATIGTMLLGIYGGTRGYRAATSARADTNFVSVSVLLNAFMYAHPCVIPWTCVCLLRRVSAHVHGLDKEKHLFAYTEWPGIVCIDTL
jgi:hypothetical protein